MNRSLPDAAEMPDGDQVLADLVEQWTARLQSGEAMDWQACERDYPEYAEQLRELLPALGALAGAADKPAEAASTTARSPSRGGKWSTPKFEMPNAIGVLGDYRLFREIGRGGMGVVYEAEQISLHRRVALKILPFAAALDGRQLQRFKTEAQAAAQLHHSNIVPVFAVGCEQGVHYYAMQFIEGQTLAQLIRQLRAEKVDRVSKIDRPNSKFEIENSKTASAPPQISDLGVADGTTIDERRTGSSILNSRSSILAAQSSFFQTVTGLGIQAAEALEYAHQMGVVHRDIKPANLLVEISTHATGHSSPTTSHSPFRLWITDFGLVRYQTDAGLTGTGDVLGTLRYMSPEQAQGKHAIVDHRADIYSLGMSLYELVTLRPAFCGQSREEVLAQLVTEEPVAPRRLNKTVPVELETIILKSLAKRPEERYVSAQELADDLRRFLEDKPILARRPSLAEKFRKWARRHRGLMRAAAVMAGLAVVGLLISVIAIARERHITEMRRRQARRAVDEMYSQFAESLLSRQPGMEALEREFLLKALNFYQEFSKEEGSAPEPRFETAKAFRRMGDIYYKLGELDKAEEAFREATDRLDQLSLEFPADNDYRRELALAYNNLANVFRDQGRMNEAEKAYRKAEQILGTSEKDEAFVGPDDRRSQAGIESNLGIVLTALGRAKEAEKSYRRSLVMLQQLAADHPDSLSYHHDLSGCLNNLGNLLTTTGRLREAEKLLRRALEIREKLASDYPTFPAYRQSLAVSQTNLGALLAAMARYPEATEHYRQSQAILEKLSKDFPATPSYRQQLASSAVGLGGVLTALGRFNDAETNYRQALELREALAAQHPDGVAFRQEVAASHTYLGQLAFLTGKYADAEREFRQALTLRQKLVDEETTAPRHRHDLAASHYHLANLMARQGRLLDAESDYRQALGLRASQAAGSWDVFDRLELASCKSDLAALLQETGRDKDAEAELRDSLDALRKLMDQFPEVAQIRLVLSVSLDRLSLVYQNTGRAADAEKALSLAVSLAEKLMAEMPANPDFRHQQAHLQIRRAEMLAVGDRISQAEEAFLPKSDQPEQTFAPKSDRAEQTLGKGLSLLAKLADDYPAVPEFRRELALGLELLGSLLAREGRQPEATQILGQVRHLREELNKNFPDIPRSPELQTKVGGQ